MYKQVMSLFSDVKERLPMKDVARYYGIMTNRSGFAKCPFHKERTPSMKIYDDHFYSFSCHCGGDIINLTSQLFFLSSLEAAKKLPMTEDNRVCAKEVINRNMLRKIQEELPKRLQQAGFDIERGEVDSNAVHRSVKQYKADMEKEKVELAVTIQSEKKELQKIAKQKSDLKSLNQISTGKTVFSGKVTIEEKDYKKISSLAQKQIVSEKRENALLQENQALRKENADLSSELKDYKSMKKRLTQGQADAEIRNLKQFQEKAIEFMKRNGIYDFFKREIIHSNKKEL